MIKNFITLAALAAASAPALAISFEGAITQGGTVVSNYASTGLISFDIDFANTAPATLDYRVDADDLNMPLALNSLLRNLSGSGIDGYAIQLSAGSFAQTGSLTRQFGGSTVVTVLGGLATFSFSPPEYLDVEVGNALGTTPGALNWTLAGLQAGDRISLTVSAVPEPGTHALWLAGLGLVGWIARRRAA